MCIPPIGLQPLVPARGRLWQAAGIGLGWGEPALLLGAERGDVQYHHPEIALCFLHSPHGAL